MLLQRFHFKCVQRKKKSYYKLLELNLKPGLMLEKGSQRVPMSPRMTKLNYFRASWVSGSMRLIERLNEPLDLYLVSRAPMNQTS